MKWLMAIPVWSTPRDSLNRFNLVFSRCPYEESPFVVTFLLNYVDEKDALPADHILPNRSPAERIRFGSEEQWDG